MSTFSQLVDHVCLGSPGAAAVLGDAMTELSDTRFDAPDNTKALLDALVRAGALSDDALLSLAIAVVEAAFAPWEPRIIATLRPSSRASRTPFLPPLVEARRAWQRGATGESPLRAARSKAMETLAMSDTRRRARYGHADLLPLVSHLGRPGSADRLARRTVGSALHGAFWPKHEGIAFLLRLVATEIEREAG